MSRLDHLLVLSLSKNVTMLTIIRL